MTEQSQPVRLDKWLWAARFFKTRSLARQAITAGRVRSQGQRTKPSRLAQVGDVLTIRRGHDQLEVIVQALSAQRRGAPEARLLYTETEHSVARREEAARRRQQLRLAGATAPARRRDETTRRQLPR